MTHFDPQKPEDLASLASALMGLPTADSVEIEDRFEQTRDKWNQGDAPEYIQPGDFETRLRSILGDACSAVQEKTSTSVPYTTDLPDGRQIMTIDIRKPYTKSSWSWETDTDEKFLRIYLVLTSVQGSPSAVPFMFMKRNDGVIAFWYVHSSALRSDSEPVPAGQCQQCRGTGDEGCLLCYGSGKRACLTCLGNGRGDSGTCPTCHGSGHITCDYCDGNATVTCHVCDGSGASRQQ
jgi:hypothetical protein